MSQRTPGPYTAQPNGVCFDLHSPDRDGRFCILVGMAGANEGEHPATVEFIVRACNAHDDLVKAAVAARSVIDELMGDTDLLHAEDNSPEAVACRMLSDVIAKATKPV